MIIVEVTGGLGNQMFQYACGKALAKRLCTDLYLDLSWFNETSRPLHLDVFNLEIKRIPNEKVEYLKKKDIISRIIKIKENLFYGGVRVFSEQMSCYDESVERVKDNILLRGYWQSEKYFRNMKAQLKEDFSFRRVFTENTVRWERDIFNETNAVSLHVRRGDYINLEDCKKIYAEITPEYYYKAIEYIKTRDAVSKIFVFSNDLQWCKENLHFDIPVSFVDGNDEGHGYEDMYLMSRCKHNVVTNSTFSWWAAWLNTNDDKIVIRPKEYYKIKDQFHDTSDLWPEKWYSI